MPRNRPGALRAVAPLHRSSLPPARIDGLSHLTCLQVHRVEQQDGDLRLAPRYTGLALRSYRAFLGPPGRRPLYPRADDCGCPSCSFRDVRHARDVLDEVLHRLSGRPRAELARLVRSLDEQFRRRTLPDPFPERIPWRGEHWWYRRLSAPCWG